MSQKQQDQRRRQETEIQKHVKESVWLQLMGPPGIPTTIDGVNKDFASISDAYNYAMDHIHDGSMQVNNIRQDGEIVITKIGLALLYQQCKGGS